MSVRSIDEVNYDEAVTVDKTAESVQGQPQAKPRELDDGKVAVNEFHITLDQPILDPNHPLAVQVPKGVGADGSEDEPLSERYAAGTPEEQFAAGDDSKDSAPKQAARRPKGDDNS